MGKNLLEKKRKLFFSPTFPFKVKSNKDLVREMEHSLLTMERSLNKIETTLSKTYDGKPVEISGEGPDVLESLYKSSKMNPCTKSSETQSEFDENMHELGPNFPKNEFQNYKFKGQILEFGDKNVFINCAFIQCPLKFGPNNVFKNCRDLHLKVLAESSTPSEMQINPKAGKIFQSTISQTDATTNYVYEPTKIQFKTSIPNIYYSLV